MGTKLYRFAVLTSVLGLLSIAMVMISGTAYPDMLFQILTPNANKIFMVIPLAQPAKRPD